MDAQLALLAFQLWSTHRDSKRHQPDADQYALATFGVAPSAATAIASHAPHQPASSKRHEARNQQQLPDHPSVSDTEPVAKPSVGYGTAGAPAAMHKAALYAVWRSGSRHGSNKLPTARLELGPTQSTYIACGSMAGASCLEGWRHKRRISQAISLPIAVANVRVCKLINGQPFVRGYFANGA